MTGKALQPVTLRCACGASVSRLAFRGRVKIAGFKGWSFTTQTGWQCPVCAGDPEASGRGPNEA